jgi:HPt (histidine-containing phosphotransfer) domain-containing protein
MALDQKALNELLMLDPDGSEGLLAQIVHSYLKDASEILYRVRNATDAGDGGTLTSDTHSLKSTSLSVWASAVGNAAAALETAGKRQALEACSDLIATLSAEFAEAEPLLREVIARS